MITINLDKAKKIHLEYYNAAAHEVAKKRMVNNMIGLPSDVDDETFLAKLNVDRDAIAAATHIDHLAAIKFPE